MENQANYFERSQQAPPKSNNTTAIIITIIATVTMCLIIGLVACYFIFIRPKSSEPTILGKDFFSEPQAVEAVDAAVESSNAVPSDIPVDVAQSAPQSVPSSSNSGSDRYAPQPADDGYYGDFDVSEWFLQLDRHRLTYADISGLSKQELRLLRNSIFARHGYIFKDRNLTNYFSNFSWYTPRTKNMTGKFNAIEQANISFIQMYE